MFLIDLGTHKALYDLECERRALPHVRHRAEWEQQQDAERARRIRAALRRLLAVFAAAGALLLPNDSAPVVPERLDRVRRDQPDERPPAA